MNQVNLDAMFDDMLGELDIISQQLEDTSEVKSAGPPASKNVQDSSASIPLPTSVTTNVAGPEDDVDLSAMLNDLSDWQQNINQGQISESASVGQESFSGINSNHLSPHTILANEQRYDGSPQFNTLKRGTGTGPSVTFDDSDNLSLASLEKDIDNDKREQDKARQLTTEELAALSPVMQELDDLVSDLSNLSFQNTLLSEPVTNLSQETKSQRDDKSEQSENSESKRSSDSSYSSSIASPHVENLHKVESPTECVQFGKKRTPSWENHKEQYNEVEDRIPKNSVLTRTGNFEKKINNLTAPKGNFRKGGSKPPPPPPGSKPRLSLKHSSAASSHEPPPTKPPGMKIKQQLSVKEEFSNRLNHQLQRQNSCNEVQPSNNQTLPSSHFNDKISQELSRRSASEIMTDPRGRELKTASFSSESTISQEAVIHQNLHHKPDFPPPYSLIEEERRLDAIPPLSGHESLSPEEREERIKAEKMRIALEKLKEARIQKLVVKVYNKDDSSKTLVVDERMTTRTVVRQLLEKNHYELSINWAIIEELPSLFMERIFEEHESVTEMLSYWTRETTNQVRFLERKDKYSLFRNPQHYLLSTSDTEGQMAERQKQTLIEEFFSGRSGSGVPEVQGILFIKGDSKSWNRKYCILRTSGLYCSKTGEPKKGKKITDLQCLVIFEQVCVYLGRGWRKKYKSPTDYGFALKHPAIQSKSKHIRYFCCEDVKSLMRWIVGIRCAKYGKQLKENFDQTNQEMKSGFSASSIISQSQQSGDSASSISGDSGDSGSRQSTLPRNTLSNMFEGAWQRASQQENADTAHDKPDPMKSSWKAHQDKQPKSNSNWWDLSDQSAQHHGDRTSAMEGMVTNSRASVSSTGSREYSKDTTPPIMLASQKNMPPPPPPKNLSPRTTQSYGYPPVCNSSTAVHATNSSSHFGGGMNPPTYPKTLPSKGPPPPPKADKPLPPPSFLKGDMPPPPDDYMFPPPPPDFVPQPPPEEDLPPPPPMDDMPLPPPMEVNSHPGLPRNLRSANTPAPVRLPILPMFKSGDQMGGMRHPVPHSPRAAMPPPPPPKNQNYSNNKPRLLPRDTVTANSTFPVRTHTSVRRIPSNPNYHQTKQDGGGYAPPSNIYAPLTQYYISSNPSQMHEQMYAKSDFPPPQRFITDLKDSIHRVNHHSQMARDDDTFDLPPPPPELLLTEVMSHQQHQKVKPAPPPPKRSPSTKLSFKKR